jgi:GNAT superfamily N-acetyltransferase
MKATEVITVGVKSHHVKRLEHILKQWVSEGFYKDFGGDSFSCHRHADTFQLLVILEDGLCVGGAVISKLDIFNEFKSRKHTDYASSIQAEGYDNFCYFCVQEDKRGKGYGALIIEYLVSNGSGYWLSSKPHLAAFYIKHGFELALEADPENLAILIYPK